MGYILPVQYTQYQEYQNRIKGVKSSYSRTARIDKLKRTYLSQLQIPINKNIQAKINRSKQPAKSADKVYAALTGIGRNFNENV
jgi:hypothetical protein